MVYLRQFVLKGVEIIGYTFVITIIVSLMAFNLIAMSYGLS